MPPVLAREAIQLEAQHRQLLQACATSSAVTAYRPDTTFCRTRRGSCRPTFVTLLQRLRGE